MSLTDCIRLSMRGACGDAAAQSNQAARLAHGCARRGQQRRWSAGTGAMSFW